MYSMRACSQEYTGLKKFVSMTNLLKPMIENNYDKIVGRLINVIKALSEKNKAGYTHWVKRGWCWHCRYCSIVWRIITDTRLFIFKWGIYNICLQMFFIEGAIKKLTQQPMITGHAWKFNDKRKPGNMESTGANLGTLCSEKQTSLQRNLWW